ncbi:hypothetical protein [Streptomyces wuyuanensis]|uniref:hypothetical protein n=1 Tax=Streptomyces wuyuanensis TaxID=1196353 RepID=UPI003432BC37
MDITEPGRARLTVDNGNAFIAREDGRYYAEIAEDADVPEAAGQSRSGLSSYRAAATWVARQLGHKGKLDIRVERD